ncbi:MAG: hypothetical protein LQ339_003097 [Xanthoria mediterranea]|nr:MAG: hypothetical protein LQ339_003097 [Xanthoria mediterranea]
MRLSQSHITVAACLSTLYSLVSSHTVITYPGWRGNNLHSPGDIAEQKGLGAGENGTYPYGMQWIYPCGGMPISTNRTLWPITGGAVGVQPGWFPGHASAFFYINLGAGSIPPNYSLPMQPVFQIIGPSNVQYDGSFCLPQVPLPANFTAKVGDNATIQVVETAQHGAALYNCVDITFAEPEDVPEVNETNCVNSTDIGFELVFSTDSLTSAASPASSWRTPWTASLPLMAAIAWGVVLI